MNSIQDKQNILDFSPNFFDHLPDEILLSILNKLQDAKSLCLSMAVCKRFRLTVPQVDSIFIPIPRKKSVTNNHDKKKKKNSFFKNLIKPLRFISKMIKFKSKTDHCDCDSYSYYVPNDALKPFDEIHNLHLRLPSSENSRNSTDLLKWRAEFGSQIHNCVILGAKSSIENPRDLPESSLITDGELKLRVVWTISCLIAAASRYHLISEAVKSRNLIGDIVVSDESDQGKLCMNRAQIDEIRALNSKLGEKEEVLFEHRSRLPCLRMKMWYLEKLELPGCGKVVDGATLVVVRPVGDGGDGRSDGELAAAAFGGDDEMVGKLMAAKGGCYTLEMSSF